MPESPVFHPLDIHARVLKCMLGSRIFCMCCVFWVSFLHAKEVHFFSSDASAPDEGAKQRFQGR